MRKRKNKKKKGFTLLELLAVIIILAIIALIATPIIMRVIENSKKAAAERSAENYVREVETVVLALKANGTTLEDGIYKIKQNGNICPGQSAYCSEENEIKIEMSGTKPSSGSIVISSGKVVASGTNNETTSIVVGDYAATINASGSATATKNESGANSGSSASTPRYYSWGSGNISGGLPSDADTDLANINTNGHPFYLAFDSEDGETIDAAYVCFTKGEPAVEYCIQGGDSGAAFESNQGILDIAYPSACSLVDGAYGCSADGLSARARSYGFVNAGDGLAACGVDGGGYFVCYEH